MEKAGSLLELIKVDSGYELDRLLICTYSANDISIETVKRNLGVSFDVDQLERFEKGSSACILVQQGGYSGNSLPNYIYWVKLDNNKNAHAKVYCIRQKHKINGQILWDIIISSANLTNADEINVYAKIRFIYNGNTPPDVGSTQKTGLVNGVKQLFLDLAAATDKKKLNKCSSFINEFWEKIECAELAESSETQYEFLIPDESVLKRIRQSAEQSQTRIVISPFIDGSAIEKILPAAQSCIVSRADTLDSISEIIQKNGYEAYVIKDPENADNDDNSEEQSEKQNEKLSEDASFTALHAKMYVFSGDGGIDLYLGSANATNSAFNGNKESLLYIHMDKNEDFINGILKLFIKYAPKSSAAKKEEIKAQLDFETKCRVYMNSFSADSENYSLSEPLEQNAEHKEQNSKYKDSVELIIPVEKMRSEQFSPTMKSIKRTEPSKHVVTLRFSRELLSGSQELKPIERTMMIDGDDNKVDGLQLIKEQQRSIVDYLRRGGTTRKNNAAQGNMRPANSNASGNDSDNILISLYDFLCKIKTKEEAKNVIENSKKIEDRLGEVEKKMLSNAIENLKDIFEI
jgi:hypothetical protein